MQAIILAAGMGKRLGEFTKDNTKCMVKVNGVTLIDRVLNQLKKLNLNRIIIVTGYKGQELKDYLNDRISNFKIEFVDNPVYDRTNNIYSLALAKKQLQEDDTLLIESDLIFEDGMFNLLVDNPYPNLALVAKYETWMDGTMVRIDDDNNIVNFVPKAAFNYNDVDYYYKTVNIYKFSKSFSQNKYVPFLEAYTKAVGNNEYYENVLRIISFLDKSDLKALPITDEKWYEIDDKQDLDIAETIFANEKDILKKYSSRYGDYWRFPKMADFCYLVNPYFPSKRLLAELNANFCTLLTEYPSGMRVNTLLTSKFTGVKEEFIVPGNGAAELIKALMENTEGKVGVIYPTFEEYPNRLNPEQLVVFKPENKDFRYNSSDLISFYADKEIKTLLVINPDNPSGNFITLDEICILADFCKKNGIRLIMDESFVDFSKDYKNNSLLQNNLLETYSNMVVMKSISKSYGVPGLRLGFLASADTELIKQIKKSVSIWNINSFAEYFMQIFSKYESDYVKAQNKFLNERDFLEYELSKIKYLRVIPSQANYILCEVLHPYTSSDLVLRVLKEHNILLKDCSSKKGFDNRSFIRIAVKNHDDNSRLVDALKNI